jgi:Acyl-ACP thioesterase
MDFSRDYLVHYYEADPLHRLSLPALVQYFEDIAILHSASKGFGLSYFDSNNCGWMLLKWDITIRAMPNFGETVTVGTRIHALKGFRAERVFSLEAKDGTLLAEGRSNWLFVDTVRRRPARIPESQYEYYGTARDNEASFVSIDDVPPVHDDCGSGLFSLTVRSAHHDIDTNRHVNNVSYISWALDSLPGEFLEGKLPAALRAHYRKELGNGCEARVLSSIDTSGLHTRHTVSTSDEECCSLEMDWR